MSENATNGSSVSSPDSQSIEPQAIEKKSENATNRSLVSSPNFESIQPEAIER